jgi:AcrR family transcriptional regulator
MSPRTPKQYRELREEKRALIMDTALLHFANEGFHKTTISHIAKHAGISKGLMYNYFKSKEELLSELVSRSVREIYNDLDPDRDGILSTQEFELFVRKVTEMLREKRTIWMLFFQMMMQNEVQKILEENLSFDDDMKFIPHVTTLFSDYFKRKAQKMGNDYNPETEMNMFIITLKGFALTLVFSDTFDERLFNNTVNNIIQVYK